MATIGVVVATFNGEKYIEEQLESICLQTFKPNTIVVTDGGSTDNTVKLCESVSKRYETIKWTILQSDRRLNVTENFERGMKNCDSDIVFLCDQDDFWYKNKIEKYRQEFQLHSDCTVIISDADVVDSELKKNGKTQWDAIRFTPRYEVLNKKTLFSEMLHRNVFTGMCMAYRNGAFIYEDIKSKYMLHDEAIGWFAVLKGEVRLINERTAAYRQHDNNAVGSKKYSKFESVKSFKNKVKESAIKTRNKYQDLAILYLDNEFITQIEHALNFHKSRTEMYDLSRFIAIFRFFLFILNGSYKRYTSKTEHSMIKDFACIVL